MELLVRVVPKVQDDLEQAPKCFQPGDVIHIAPDGHDWTVAERTNPEWRIVRVPLLEAEIEALLTPPPHSEITPRIQKRGKRVNIPALPNQIRNFLSRERDPAQIFDISRTTFINAIMVTYV